MSDDRTERASARRRQKAAERGDRVFSRELVASSATLAALLAIAMLAPHWPGLWLVNFGRMLTLASETSGAPSSHAPGILTVDVSGWIARLRMLLLVPLVPVALVLLSTLGSALLVAVAQARGVRLSVSPLSWNWSRLNPFEGVKHIFSLRGGARFLRSLLPAAVLVYFAVHRIEDQAALPWISSSQLGEMFVGSYHILLDTAWILFAWSAVDYVVEWRSWESRQKMTKQEVREEHKESEGNPQVRGRIKSLRRQMRRRMLQVDVRRASVVITNPTHYAVALSFDFDTMEPPRMLAKGRNLIAAQIREEARWAGIPIVENPPLARSLYHSLEPGQGIPYNLYAAVAAILGYLYRQRLEERMKEERMRNERLKQEQAERLRREQTMRARQATPVVLPYEGSPTNKAQANKKSTGEVNP